VNILKTYTLTNWKIEKKHKFPDTYDPPILHQEDTNNLNR
jgi:hypothetical protein